MTRFLAKLTAPAPWLILGLDPQREMMPPAMRGAPDGLAQFCRAAVDACGEFIDGVKINLAFFEAEGSAGLRQMEQVLGALPPRLATISDAKRGDIGSSSAMYARALFDAWNFDAATVNPLMGGDAVAPFLDYADRTIFLLAKTSNPGAADFIGATDFFARLMEKIGAWNTRGNAGVVIGATQPDAIAAALDRWPALPILAPGLGAQGAGLEPLRAILRRHPAAPLVLPISRGILNPPAGATPETIRAAARQWHAALAEMRTAKP